MSNVKLKVQDLHVAYGQSEALHGVSFEGLANETVAIMGRNGMGKTTLFKALMGILPAKSGRIEVDGHDVTRDESFRRVAKGIAYVPQGPGSTSRASTLRHDRGRAATAMPTGRRWPSSPSNWTGCRTSSTRTGATSCSSSCKAWTRAARTARCERCSAR